MSEKLAQLGRELPEYQPTEDRREALRTALLLEAEASGPRPRRRVVWVAPVVVAAAAAVALWLWLPRGAETATAPMVAHRATVQSPAGARFVHQALPDGEVVKLEQGKVTVAVAGLDPRERFRVLAPGAEIETRAAAFDVAVDGDAIAEIAVHTGSVEIRTPQRTVLLAAGDTWRPEVTTAELELPEPDTAPAPDTAPDTAPALDTAPDTTPARDTAPAPDTTPARDTAPAPDTTPAPSAADPVPALEPAAGAAPPAPAASPVERAFQTAWTAMRARDFAAAARGFAAAIAADPDHAMAEDARYWRAIALARVGDKPAAARAMRSYLARHRDAARAGEIAVMLGWIELEQDNRDAAEKHFDFALRDASKKVRDSARAGLDALGR